MTPRSRPPLWHPRHWPAWIGLGLGRLLALLPLPALLWLGRRIGDLAMPLIGSRRRVAEVNLALCFPGLSVQQRRALLREHFRSVGMGLFETLFAWWAGDARVDRWIDPEGAEALRKACAAQEGRGILLLSAHFTSLELGVRMASKALRPLGRVTTAMYKAPHDPVLDRVMRARRDHHIGESSIRDRDVRGLVRALRAGRAVWYAADQRGREQASAIVPFFGHDARTHVATSRLAEMGGARVIPFFALRAPDGRGYRLIVRPPLEDFPGTDEVADARRINSLIEEIVRMAPEQYFWLHKRFELPDRDPYASAGPGDAGSPS